MKDKNGIDFDLFRDDPCPSCGGDIVYLGEEKQDRKPVHTLFCYHCQTFWEIECKAKRLLDAWKDICNREKND